MENSGQPLSKDFWDKISSISQLLAGILVALIGALFTGIYANKESAQREMETKRDTAQRNFEIRIQQEAQRNQNRILEMQAL